MSSLFVSQAWQVHCNVRLSCNCSSIQSVNIFSVCVMELTVTDETTLLVFNDRQPFTHRHQRETIHSNL